MYCDQTTGDLLLADDDLRRRHLAAWGAASTRPVAVHAEGATVEALLALVRELRVRVHFCHVSTAAEMGLLREAKRDGLPISVGVTPHHLYLTAEDAARLGPFGLVKPFLKSAADNEALWAGIRDGTVDVVESDHAPHTRAEKLSATPPYGLPGLETTLPLLVLAVHEGRLGEERLVELVSRRAAADLRAAGAGGHVHAHRHGRQLGGGGRCAPDEPRLVAVRGHARARSRARGAHPRRAWPSTASRSAVRRATVAC